MMISLVKRSWWRVVCALLIAGSSFEVHALSDASVQPTEGIVARALNIGVAVAAGVAAGILAQQAGTMAYGSSCDEHIKSAMAVVTGALAAAGIATKFAASDRYIPLSVVIAAATAALIHRNTN